MFYSYIKGSRPVDAGHIGDDGTLAFGHQVSTTLGVVIARFVLMDYSMFWIALSRYGALTMVLATPRSISKSLYVMQHEGGYSLCICSTDLKLSKSVIGRSEDFSVTVTVHNNGRVQGKEVVQVCNRITFLETLE